MTPPLLSVRDFALSFDQGPGPRIQAVDGLSLTVYPRQTVAVVGESGCGKSVSAMSLLQLVPRPPGRFDRGSALFDTGEGVVDLFALSEDRIRRIRGNQIAMIFQEPMTSLNPVYTVGEQIMEAVRLHRKASRKEARAAAIEAMRDVGIADPESRVDQYPHQFSGGMRQRVMIAMALACRPRLLLADEPTTALDVTVQAQILELLRSLQQSHGMAVLLITHDLGVVAENADVVCVMYAGRVVEYARVNDLFERPLHPYTRGLLNSIPRLGARRDRLVTVREVVDDPAEMSKLPGGERGVRAWWPWHEPPRTLMPKEGPAGEYMLLEVEPGHWVGVWRTGAVVSAPETAPDLCFRRSEVGRAAAGVAP
jgi:ABC-type dipeptide/oligopeptide/nickel transport system ATPase component